MSTKTHEQQGTEQGFEILRRFALRPRRKMEHCELCAAELHADHPHLIELTQRKLICACDACAMLFGERAEPMFSRLPSGTASEHGQSAHHESGPRLRAKYKRVPREVRLLADFRMSDAEWESLLIPINLAFFFHNSTNSRVSAFYPSPAGATESLLPLEAWNSIARENPILEEMEADVEALLINRVGAAREGRRPDYYMVPIDECYKLVGLIRLHWQGLSGGAEVWQEIGSFFSRLRERAGVVREELHARS